MKNIKLILLLTTLVTIIVAGWFWWQHQSLHPSSDDAYVQANILTIAPLIGGTVEQVSVKENSYVVEGSSLFDIDASSYLAELEAAEAQLDMATQGTGADRANVSAAEATLASTEAAMRNATQTLERQQALYDKGDVTRSTLDAVEATHDEAVAEHDQANAALQAARAKLGDSGAENAGVRAARAVVTSARLNVERASIKAPASGWVVNLSLRPGSAVAANQPLFSIVEDEHWWIDANFKETDIERIRSGQPVRITLDMYGALELNGEVESIGAGSGAVFSLLPAENASGNWVKVTQRFPLRISLDAPPADKERPLRVGASASVTVDTTGLVEK